MMTTPKFTYSTLPNNLLKRKIEKYHLCTSTLELNLYHCSSLKINYLWPFYYLIHWTTNSLRQGRIQCSCVLMLEIWLGQVLFINKTTHHMKGECSTVLLTKNSSKQTNYETLINYYNFFNVKANYKIKKVKNPSSLLRWTLTTREIHSWV